MGDGLLIEFPSVLEAVTCAVEIQRELGLFGEQRPPERHIRPRIGINIGDVIRKAGDVFGTGVNIAARLDSLAEPGSIYISGEAYDQVRDRPFVFDDLGMKSVKNISRLVRVYRVRAGEASLTSYRPPERRARAPRFGLMVASAVALLVVVAGAAIMFFLPARQTNVADALPSAVDQTSGAVDEMTVWRDIKTSDKLADLRELGRRNRLCELVEREDRAKIPITDRGRMGIRRPAGSVIGRYFGDAPICDFANVRDQSKRQVYSAGQFWECNGGISNTSPVGSFPPTGFGLYDMIGNAWEWVEDCWARSYADAPSDGSAREEERCNFRARRGASWNTTDRPCYTLACRASGRPDWRWEIFGFRVARDYAAAATSPAPAR